MGMFTLLCKLFFFLSKWEFAVKWLPAMKSELCSALLGCRFGLLEDTGEWFELLKEKMALQVTFCPRSVVLVVFSMQCSPWGPILYWVGYCGLRNHNRVLLLVILIWKIDSWIIREKKGGILLENLEQEGLFVCLCASTKETCLISFCPLYFFF